MRKIMKVKLISYTQPVSDMISEGIVNVQDLVAFCARVSNPSNQYNTETSDKLISYLIKHKHFSPLEMVSACLEIETTRDIGRQILRHRSFSFQEFCVTGDTMITLEQPSSIEKNKRAAYKRSIEHLYNLQEKNGKMPKYARVFDEDTKTFVGANIKAVLKTGMKPVYKITLANGKNITSTKEHKFYTQNGFKTLENAVGLTMIGNTATMQHKVFLACNGVKAYQDRDWLNMTKQVSIENKGGLSYIAEVAEVSTHTIRKWLRKHNLQFTKKEVASYTPIWNKGRYGYHLPKHSMETINKLRKSARRGPDSNLWRGGVNRSERLKIADWCNANRSEFLKINNYECNRCGSNEKLELHHKLAVSEYPEMAYDKNNIEVVCNVCHRKHHKMNGDTKTWLQKSKGNRLTVEWSEVVNIEYMGEQMTYDIEVDHISHNYVGNGILTHNSQRYADPTKDMSFELREARLQDVKNRQNSIDLEYNDENRILMYQWENIQNEVLDKCENAYKWAIEKGIAKEQARAVLPEGLTQSRMYMNGTLRSWIHYIELRSANGTQKEHMEIARECARVIAPIFPLILKYSNQD